MTDVYFIVDDVGRPEIKPIVTSGVVINIAIINHDTAELIAKIKQLFEDWHLNDYEFERDTERWE